MKEIYCLLIMIFIQFNCAKNFKSDDNQKSGYPVWYPPEITYKGNTIYPDSLKMKKITGTVWVECIIDTSGELYDKKIYKSTNTSLNNAALQTVENYKFHSGKLGDEKIQGKLVIPLKFEK